MIPALIIFSGLIIHACITAWSTLEMQRKSSSNQRYIQIKQQEHETEFAKKQAELFRSRGMN